LFEGREVGIGGNEGEDVRFYIEAEVRLGSPLDGVPFFCVDFQRCRSVSENILGLVESEECFEHSRPVGPIGTIKLRQFNA